MESKGMFKKVDLQYPWIDIISFKAPISNIHLPNWDIIKKCRWDEINFETINTKLGDNFKLIKNKLSERQPFILINKKTVKDSENNRNNTKKLSSKTMIYLHGNGEDIGNVLGHWIDLSTQLKWNVLIPELSGFGAYNKGLRNVTNKNTLLNKWVNDINNALLVAKDQTNSDNYEDIIIYSKGMSSSIVLELLKFNQLKNIVFEDITSDIDTMNKYFKLKSMKLSKSWYSQMKNNYILNSLNCIKNINFLKKPVWRSNSNYEKDDHLNLSLNKQSIDSVSDWDWDKILAPSFSVPRILFISKDSLHQRVMTNDVIWAMLSKIYNVENWKPNVRIEKVLNEFKNSFSKNAQGVTEQNYSGWIKHMIFRESDSMDFKKQHRSQFLDALNWISY